MNLKQTLPPVLLSGLILLPVAVVAVVGFALIKHEQVRLEGQTYSAQVRLLEQVATDIQLGLKNVQDEMVEILITLPEGDQNQKMMDLRNRNPLVRNVFRVTETGTRILPPNGLNLDAESLRFLRRYESLFTGRTPWFDSSPDAAPKVDQSENTRQILNSFKSTRKRAPASSTPDPPATVEWRPWQWEDKNGILLYIQTTGTRDILGMEIEMNALYARLDVLLRNLSKSGEPLLLVNRENDILIASEEPYESGPVVYVEAGPMLPFARLGLSLPAPGGTGKGTAFFITASAVGGLLILCMIGGTFGLMAWVHRSRKEAIQKTTFVSNVSHEFKTPLTTLRLYSELLLEGRVTDKEKQLNYLKTLRNESERLARLVHNVLDFSRLEMGRSRFHPQALQLNERIQVVAERMSERLTNSGIQLKEVGTKVHIYSDPDGTDQILINLFDNAIKYAVGASTIRIQAGEQEGVIRIEFSDDGPGIPVKEHKRIFKPFHQLDDRLTREKGGTGLGLHISRRIARQMKGDLWVQPHNTGACFVWTVPKTGENNE